jgi:polysaccharide biosynthesis transport protein
MQEITNSGNSNHLVPVTSPAPLPLTYYGSEFEFDQGIHLRDYWHVLKKRKWWFLGVLLGVVIISLLVTFLMSPIYKVTTTLQIVQDNPSALMGGSNTDPLGALTGSSEMDRFYETQYKVLQSPAIAYALIDSLNLKEHPSYKDIADVNKDLSPEAIKQKYSQWLLDKLKVEPVKNSYLVDISFKSTDKNLAQQIPAAIQKEYLKLAMSTRQQSYDMLRDWLDKELSRLGRKLETSEQEFFAHGQKNDALSFEDPQVNVILQKYVQLGQLLTTAQSDKANKEAQYRQIKEKGLDAPLITNHPLIQQLRQQLIGLEAQVTGDSKIFGNNYPDYKAQATKMKDLRQRLNQEIKRLEASVKADYEAASRTEKLLAKDVELQKSNVVGLQNDLVQQHGLKRDLQTNQTLYEGLLARMKEASVASTMVASNVSVINPAELPYKPWLPKPLLFLALALVIGSMGGVATAFFVEYMDSSIKTTDELEKACLIPALGVVPLVTQKFTGLSNNGDSPKPLVSLDPKSMLAEAIYHIRSALMLSVSEAPPQAIVVTSASPDEGKTTMALNLGFVMASAERKGLIIDCDLRKPGIHKSFDQALQPGLSNYLTGSATFEDIIRATKVPNLYFIPAGATPPNPNELLGSEAFKKLTDRLRMEFQYIIFDTPPLIGFADARLIASYADGVVFTVKHHSTSREAGRLATQMLFQNNCRILGGVLSMAQKEHLGYGGYYSYYQYYHKYYKQYSSDGGKSPK